MLLRKTLSLSDVDLKMDGDVGTFAGYAAVFGNVDTDGDIILRGAFESTLRNHGKPKMFFNHDWSSIPIGRWTVAKEDAHGLFVEGEFTPGLAAADAVRAAMKHGTLDGLSVGGLVKVGDWEDSGNSQRLIRKWSRLIEVSPVVFPANEFARVDAASVKGGSDMIDAINDIESARDLESLLRDAAGLSKGAAIALVARVKLLFGRGEPAQFDDEAMKGVFERIQRIASH